MIYVGPIDRIPKGIKRASEFDFLQPEEIAELSSLIQHDFWTNYPEALDKVNVENIQVLTPKGPKYLSDHPEYDRWKSMLLNGEFWQSVGSDW